MHLRKITVAAILSLLELSVSHKKAEAATLCIGRYGSFGRDINLVGFIPQSQSVKQFIDSSHKYPIVLDRSQIEKEVLITKIDALASAEPLKEQIEKDYNSFDSQVEDNSSNVEDLSSDSTIIANSEEINQNIEERYQGLIETNSEKIALITANKLIDDLSNNSTDNKAQIESALDNIDTNENNALFSKSLTGGFFLLIVGSGFFISIPILNSFSSDEKQGLFGLFGGSFGRPKVPDTAIALCDRYLKKIVNLATKAEQIDDEKFGTKEFVLYIQLRNKVARGINEYQQIGQSIQYLEVAITASSSYLKIEQTELRYRSRKQQAFYQFVIDNITDDIDKFVFRDRVKNKLAEILPLINSEEGSSALKSYVVEINKISQHALGLKLLALFKKYQLTDFAILRKVSDIVEQINAQDVLSDKKLMIIILENYEVLEKLAPIIGIAKKDIKPETFTKILQYMGLVRRHEKSFQQFQELIKVLKQWQKPYQSLKQVREQYPVHQYRVPKQFSQQIPGLKIYQKYEKYLDNY
jgi:hypothetical protein